VARPTSDTELFFATLASRGQEQLLQKVVGTIRFDAVGHVLAKLGITSRRELEDVLPGS
jgi:hypothetical protein